MNYVSTTLKSLKNTCIQVYPCVGIYPTLLVCDYELMSESITKCDDNKNSCDTKQT